MASEIQALVELNQLNNKAQAADSTKNLLLYLVRFVQKFYDNQELKTVVEAIQQQAQTDHKKVLELREKTLASINAIHRKFSDYCSSRGIFIETSYPFDAYDNPDPQKRMGSTRDICIEKHEMLENLFLRLTQTSSAHYNFVSQFAAITPPLGEKYYQRISVTVRIPSYYEWLDARQNLEDQLPTLVWHHWDCILCIYLAIKDRDKILKPDNQNYFFEQWRVSDLRRRAINTINDRDDCNPKFDMPSLKYSSQNVLDYTNDMFATTKKHAALHKISKPSYNPTTGILKVIGIDIPFDPKSNRGITLKCVFSAKKKTYMLEKIYGKIHRGKTDSLILEKKDKDEMSNQSEKFRFLTT